MKESDDENWQRLTIYHRNRDKYQHWLDKTKWAYDVRRDIGRLKTHEAVLDFAIAEEEDFIDFLESRYGGEQVEQ